MELRHTLDTHTDAYAHTCSYPAAVRLHVHVRRRVLHDYARATRYADRSLGSKVKSVSVARMPACGRDRRDAYIDYARVGVCAWVFVFVYICAHMNRHIVYSTAYTYGMCASRETEKESYRERNFRATIEMLINARDASA